MGCQVLCEVFISITGQKIELTCSIRTQTLCLVLCLVSCFVCVVCGVLSIEYCLLRVVLCGVLCVACGLPRGAVRRAP